MPISLDKFRAKFVLKLLYPVAGFDAGKYIKRTVQLLKKENLATDTIQSVIDKMIHQLDNVKQATTDNFKWQQLAVAILALTEMKQQLH